MFTFCPRCLETVPGGPQSLCQQCGAVLQPLFDEEGALTRDYLLALGACCDRDCRNCPYQREVPAPSPALPKKASRQRK